MAANRLAHLQKLSKLISDQPEVAGKSSALQDFSADLLNKMGGAKPAKAIEKPAYLARDSAERRTLQSRGAISGNPLRLPDPPRRRGVSGAGPRSSLKSTGPKLAAHQLEEGTKSVGTYAESLFNKYKKQKQSEEIFQAEQQAVTKPKPASTKKKTGRFKEDISSLQNFSDLEFKGADQLQQEIEDFFRSDVAKAKKKDFEKTQPVVPPQPKLKASVASAEPTIAAKDEDKNPTETPRPQKAEQEFRIVRNSSKILSQKKQILTREESESKLSHVSRQPSEGRRSAHQPPSEKPKSSKQPGRPSAKLQTKETSKRGVKFITEIEVPDDSSSQHSRLPSTTSFKSKPVKVPAPRPPRPVEETKEADSESFGSDFSFDMSEGELAQLKKEYALEEQAEKEQEDSMFKEMVIAEMQQRTLLNTKMGHLGFEGQITFLKDRADTLKRKVTDPKEAFQKGLRHLEETMEDYDRFIDDNDRHINLTELIEAVEEEDRQKAAAKSKEIWSVEEFWKLPKLPDSPKAQKEDNPSKVFAVIKAKRGSKPSYEIASNSRLNSDLDGVLPAVKEVEEEKYQSKPKPSKPTQASKTTPSAKLVKSSKPTTKLSSKIPIKAAPARAAKPSTNPKPTRDPSPVVLKPASPARISEADSLSDRVGQLSDDDDFY